jgi:nicotinamide mononucleotide (NMN) deamidase PncC
VYHKTLDEAQAGGMTAHHVEVDKDWSAAAGSTTVHQMEAHTNWLGVDTRHWDADGSVAQEVADMIHLENDAQH